MSRTEMWKLLRYGDLHAEPEHNVDLDGDFPDEEMMGEHGHEPELEHDSLKGHEDGQQGDDVHDLTLGLEASPKTHKYIKYY